MGGLSRAGGSKMAEIYFVHKKNANVQAKVHRATASISVTFQELKKTLASPNLQRVICVSLTVLEIFALILDLSLT